MFLTSKIFVLVLTSCTMSQNGTEQCKDTTLESFSNMPACIEQMDKEVINITDIDLLSCEKEKD